MGISLAGSDLLSPESNGDVLQQEHTMPQSELHSAPTKKHQLDSCYTEGVKK